MAAEEGGGASVSLLDVIGSYWFGSSLTFLVAVVLGFMAHRSPKTDWDFLKTWPLIFAAVLTFIVLPYIKLQAAEEEAREEMSRHWICLDDMNGDGDRDDPLECPNGPYIPSNPYDHLAPEASWSLAGKQAAFAVLDVPLEAVGVILGGVLAGKRRKAPRQ